MALPSDPFILLSYINTLLRDRYDSLERLCDNEDIDPEQLCAKLEAIHYHYDAQTNSFQ